MHGALLVLSPAQGFLPQGSPHFLVSGETKRSNNRSQTGQSRRSSFRQRVMDGRYARDSSESEKRSRHGSEYDETGELEARSRFGAKRRRRPSAHMHNLITIVTADGYSRPPRPNYWRNSDYQRSSRTLILSHFPRLRIRSQHVVQQSVGLIGRLINYPVACPGDHAKVEIALNRCENSPIVVQT